MSDSCDHMDCSLPGSSVHGILQARILEWVAISFSRGASWPRDRILVSCTTGKFFTDWVTRETLKWKSLSDSLWPHGLHSPWNSLGQNTGVGSSSLHQGIFQTQGSNPGLLHCRRILYQLSHKGSPTTLEWAAYPFSSRSSQTRNWTRVSCIAGGFFTNWAFIRHKSPMS